MKIKLDWLKAIKITVYFINGMVTPFITFFVFVYKIYPRNTLEWLFLIGINVIYILGYVEIGTLIKDYYFQGKTWHEIYIIIRQMFKNQVNK